jgi:hypothetical protein
MDFDYPLKQVWKGYVNPYSSITCRSCGGSGQNEATRQIDKEWYALDNRDDVNLPNGRHYNNNAHCYHLTQLEVDALITGDRLYSLKKQLGKNPTVAEVNHWARTDTMGHDGINKWICVEARAKAAGVYGYCPCCEGKGYFWANEEIAQKAEEWKKENPPVGDGYQLWETTTEGSPQSPVFTTLKELAIWCEINATIFADIKVSADDWERMLHEDTVHAEIVPGVIAI